MMSVLPLLGYHNLKDARLIGFTVSCGLYDDDQPVPNRDASKPDIEVARRVLRDPKSGSVRIESLVKLTNLSVKKFCRQLRKLQSKRLQGGIIMMPVHDGSSSSSSAIALALSHQPLQTIESLKVMYRWISLRWWAYFYLATQFEEGKQSSAGNHPAVPLRVSRWASSEFLQCSFPQVSATSRGRRRAKRKRAKHLADALLDRTQLMEVVQRAIGRDAEWIGRHTESLGRWGHHCDSQHATIRGRVRELRAPDAHRLLTALGPELLRPLDSEFCRMPVGGEYDMYESDRFRRLYQFQLSSDASDEDRQAVVLLQTKHQHVLCESSRVMAHRSAGSSSKSLPSVAAGDEEMQVEFPLLCYYVAAMRLVRYDGEVGRTLLDQLQHSTTVSCDATMSRLHQLTYWAGGVRRLPPPPPHADGTTAVVSKEWRLLTSKAWNYSSVRPLLRRYLRFV
jgi:hypothetical protein